MSAGRATSPRSWPRRRGRWASRTWCCTWSTTSRPCWSRSPARAGPGGRGTRPGRSAGCCGWTARSAAAPTPPAPSTPSTPLGVPFGSGPVEVGEEALEPGDRVLLYTDGVTEARTADGAFFTLERLAEFLERQAAAGLPTPETLRRLRQAIFDHQAGQLQDDVTALLVEWRRDSELALLPQTVDG
ncbi:MAG: PP2C family protein-serine/threonine phosphatase [Mycobacteriales bacterium]